ncbi:MAG: hypothetical protein EON53_05970 [Actinomycetales bacterium]|nr:MAG: hypothetical protein EON53_05970 [Actinomycetales bacterium]
MKKLKAAMAAAILGSSSVLVAGTAASAAPLYPGNCITTRGTSGWEDWGAVRCTSGGGSVRVVIKCSFAGQTPGTHYGPWVGISQQSKKWCPLHQGITSMSYERTT